jgi:hypothetical protein
MYRSKILNRIMLNYFLKLIIYELNSEMVKSKIVLLIEKEKADVADANVVMRYILQPAVRTVVDEREKKTNIT